MGNLHNHNLQRQCLNDYSHLTDFHMKAMKLALYFSTIYVCGDSYRKNQLEYDSILTCPCLNICLFYISAFCFVTFTSSF